MSSVLDHEEADKHRNVSMQLQSKLRKKRSEFASGLEEIKSSSPDPLKVSQMWRVGDTWFAFFIRELEMEVCRGPGVRI
jgi:hypothetical protein